jgi:hypothetical protein
MRYAILFLWFLLVSEPASSAELSASDAGVYVIVGKDGKLVDTFYRLTLTNGAWRAEGREGQGTWKNISCDQGCEYKTSTSLQADAYLPPQMKQGFTMACIQNMAQAFCKYTNKSNSAQSGYVVMALVTSPPTPIPVQRQR